jgi:fluoroacetyl-CoA thioesterase
VVYYSAMSDIPIGTAAEHRILVTPEFAIDFLGMEAARVLSTPNMIRFMEVTSRNAIKPLLDSNHDSVGILVNIRHLGATPVGMSVRFSSKVTGVDGNRVTFAVEAWDEQEKVGEGTHERYIVNIAKFVTRLAAKSGAA